MDIFEEKGCSFTYRVGLNNSFTIRSECECVEISRGDRAVFRSVEGLPSRSDAKMSSFES